MPRLFFITILFALQNTLLLCSTNAATMDEYTAILAEADKARGYYNGLNLDVSLSNENTIQAYHVMVSGFDFLAIAQAPEKNQGNRILMNSGMMWLHKADRRSISPVPRAQRLIGDASYGDILSTNYSQNYSIESVKDVKLNNRSCWFYILKSKKSVKTNLYSKIHLWIDKHNKTAIKAHFLAVSGKVLKISKMQYEQKLVINNSEKPLISRMTVLDKIKNTPITSLEFKRPIIKKISPDYFKRDSFYKLKFPVD